VRLADVADAAAELLVVMRGRARRHAEAAARKHRDDIRIGADHRQAACGRSLELCAEVPQPGVVLDPGEQQELGVLDPLDHVQRQARHRRAVAGARPQDAAPAERLEERIDAVGERLPGRLARGHERVVQRRVDAHLGQARAVDRRPLARVAEQHDPLARFA
jgi:hypothetical protein